MKQGHISRNIGVVRISLLAVLISYSCQPLFGPESGPKMWLLFHRHPEPRSIWYLWA